MRKKKTQPRKQIRTVPLQVGELTTQKQDALNGLRTSLLSHAQAIADLLFVPEPLAIRHDPKRIFRLSANYQKQQSGINKAYLQIIGKQVEQAAFEQEKRYFARLFGRLRNVGSEIPKAEQKDRLYYYVPVDVQAHVTEADFVKLSAISELEFATARTLLREVLIEGAQKDFTLIQRAILQEIHEQALRRHRQLSFKDTEETSISIPLDYRMLPRTEEGAKLLGDLSSQVQLLLDRKNKQYQFFISLSAPTPRADRIKLPVTISASVLERLLKADQADVNSLTLVLGQNKVSVRMAISKPHAEPQITGDYLVARDFGYVNTISLSVIQLEEQLDHEKLVEIQSFTKEQAKKFLTTHALPDGESQVVERVRFSGRKFLDKISAHCETIDTLRSWIDTAYNKLELLKKEIVSELGLPADALLVEESTHSQTRKFFQLLAKINKWKARRRGVYKKIAGLKKSWFGYLSNQELALA